MQHSIEIEIDEETGEIRMNNVNFTGSDCLKFTQALEQNLGQVISREIKPEFNANQSRRIVRQQGIRQ